MASNKQSANGTLNFLFLLSNYFHHSSTYHSLFLKHDTNHITAIHVYVDDIIITGNNVEEINKITHPLDINFHIKHLGDVTYFLG